jgi:hypothetical protein
LTSSPTSSSFTSIGPAKSGGLSRGAAAGIGIGATLGFLIILVMAALLFLWRRRNERSSEVKDDTSAYYSKPELPDNQMRVEQSVTSNGGQNSYQNELEGSHTIPVELQGGKGYRAELGI